MLSRLPKYTLHPGPLRIIVLDNAKIHHGPEVLELCAEFGKLHFIVSYSILILALSFAGVCVKYLPPYSPDLNPIEDAFSKIKAFLYHHHNYYNQTTGDSIHFDMFEVVEIIMPMMLVTSNSYYVFY